MYKKVCCSCKVVALPINPLLFLPFSLPLPSPSPLSLLKLPSLYFTSVDADSDEVDRKAPLLSRGPNTSTVWKRIHCMQFLSCTTSTENENDENSNAVIEKVVAIAYERLQL